MPDLPPPQTFIRPAAEPDWPAAQAILLESAATLPTDLVQQAFEREVAYLPGDYAAPRGSLLLACGAGYVFSRLFRQDR